MSEQSSLTSSQSDMFSLRLFRPSYCKMNPCSAIRNCSSTDGPMTKAYTHKPFVQTLNAKHTHKLTAWFYSFSFSSRQNNVKFLNITGQIIFELQRSLTTLINKKPFTAHLLLIRVVLQHATIVHWPI